MIDIIVNKSFMSVRIMKICHESHGDYEKEEIYKKIKIDVRKYRHAIRK